MAIKDMSNTAGKKLDGLLGDRHFRERLSDTLWGHSDVTFISGCITRKTDIQ